MMWIRDNEILLLELLRKQPVLFLADPFDEFKEVHSVLLVINDVLTLY